MSPAPTFLVYMPVRNGQRYVTESVGSVLRQTEADLRLYVLDNRSSDDTLALVRSFGDPRIVIQESTAELSIARSWGRILDVLRAAPADSLVTLIGHDDVLYPQFLTEIGRLARAHPDASLYQTHFHLIDAEGRTIRPSAPMPTVETASEYFRCRAWGFRDSFGSGIAFSASDYVAVGGIPDFPRLLYADDALMLELTRLSYKATSPAIAHAVRFHESSASGSQSLAKNCDLVRAVDRWCNEIRERHPDLIADEVGQVALGRLVARALAGTDLGCWECAYPQDVREIRRRLAAAAVEYLHGARNSDLGRLHTLLRRARLNTTGARRYLEAVISGLMARRKGVRCNRC